MKGHLIYACPTSGKTTFVANQQADRNSNEAWADGDSFIEHVVGNRLHISYQRCIWQYWLNHCTVCDKAYYSMLDEVVANMIEASNLGVNILTNLQDKRLPFVAGFTRTRSDLTALWVKREHEAHANHERNYPEWLENWSVTDQSSIRHQINQTSRVQARLLGADEFVTYARIQYELEFNRVYALNL